MQCLELRNDQYSIYGKRRTWMCIRNIKGKKQGERLRQKKIIKRERVKSIKKKIRREGDKESWGDNGK